MALKQYWMTIHNMPLKNFALKKLDPSGRIANILYR
jgi:hypothetical protein